jgi:hypothetical protein
MSMFKTSLRTLIRSAAVGAVLIAGLTGCSSLDAKTAPDQITVSGSAGVVLGDKPVVITGGGSAGAVLPMETASPNVVTVSGSAGINL